MLMFNLMSLTGLPQILSYYQYVIEKFAKFVLTVLERQILNLAKKQSLKKHDNQVEQNVHQDSPFFFFLF